MAGEQQRPGFEAPRVRVGSEDPFATPADQRRADRRLRGRLVAPVTVWTAGPPDHRVGLTVSSVLVAEGDPPRLLGLVDPLSELRQAIGDLGAFSVHVLEEGDRRVAVGFAGGYPGDPFDGLEVTDTDFGPVISGERAVASCRFEAAREIGYQDLVSAVIEAVELPGGDTGPLAHYRGGFRRLAGP